MPVQKPDDTTHVDYDPYLHTWNSSMHLNPPVFGIRSQISYATYWKALVYSSDGSHQSDYVYMDTHGDRRTEVCQPGWPSPSFPITGVVCYFYSFFVTVNKYCVTLAQWTLRCLRS